MHRFFQYASLAFRYKSAFQPAVVVSKLNKTRAAFGALIRQVKRGGITISYIYYDASFFDVLHRTPFFASIVINKDRWPQPFKVHFNQSLWLIYRCNAKGRH